MFALTLLAPALASTVWPVGDRWLVEQWGTADGLPMVHLNDVEVGPDGRLWLATYGGLLHFDGSRFESLGVGTDAGVHSPRVLQVVRQPGTDALWVTFVSGRLERHSPAGIDRFEPVGSGGPSLASDGETLWLSAGDDVLFELDDAPTEVARVDVDLHVLQVDRDGVLWNRNTATGELTALSPDAEPSSAAPFRELSAGDWTSDHRTLWRDGVEVLVVDEGIHGLSLDDDVLWLATGAGLFRVRERPLDVVRPPDGLGPSVDQLFWEEGRQILWARSDDRAWWSVLDPTVRLDPADVDEPPWPDAERLPSASLPLEPRPGVLWWATQGVVQAADPLTGALEPVAETPRFWAPLTSWRAADGRLWLGSTSGVHVWEADRWKDLEGQAPLHWARSFVELDDGATVLAVQGGLAWTDLDTVIGPSAPFPATVRHVRRDGASLWLATEERGLCVVAVSDVPGRLDAEDAWRCLGEGSGLRTYGVHTSVEDDRGRTWVSSNQGLAWAETARLREFARGEIDDVAFLWLGVRDGMRSAEANGSLGGAVVVAHDSLWFPTQDGVVRLHPDRVEPPDAPSLRLTEPVVDGQPAHQVHLDDPRDAVQISWAAVSLAAPDRVVYRHRLGPDGRWSPPSATSSLLLDRLAPGELVLEVQAGLADRWGPPIAVTVHRAPTFTERPLTRAAFAGALVLGVVLAFRLRLLAAMRREDELTQRVGEATRSLRETSEELRALYTASAAQAERLQQLDEAKRQLLANVSHELRTPISLILGPLGVLAERLDGDDLATVELAIRNGERLDGLVGQLLDLARSGGGMLRLEARRVHIGAHVASLVQRFPMLEDDRRLTLALCHPDPAVWCDPEMLDTIVGNLVANAREHGAGAIEVAVELDLTDSGPACVRVAVRDQGAGLPDGEGDLFERFQQAPAAAQRGGLGLGLALVRELVELHGGEVSAATRPEGGAEFAFTLPLGVEHLGLEDISTVSIQQDPAPVTPAPASDEATGLRVLLVEDNLELRRFLESHLSARYRVLAVETAEEALEALVRAEFDLLISDVMLPGISGLQLASWVHDHGPQGLPVLIISAKGEVGDRVDGLAVADDYLAKPFQMRELLARCGALLRRRALREAPEPTLEDEPARPLVETRFLERLEAAADERLADSGLDLDALARAVGVSKRSLHDRLQGMGLPSPGVWLRERRLDRAEALISAGAFETVGEVAAAVGLSRAYFSRAFKARTGTSPGERLQRRG